MKSISIDTELTLAGFDPPYGFAVNGTYRKGVDSSGTKYWEHITSGVQIYLNNGRWTIRSYSTPDILYLDTEQVSTAYHPGAVAWTDLTDPENIGTITPHDPLTLTHLDLTPFENLESISLSGFNIEKLTWDPTRLNKVVLSNFNTSANKTGLSFQHPYIGGNSSMTHFILRNNDISGRVSMLPPSLQYYDMAHNNLSGELPTFAGLYDLIGFDIESNNIGKTLPSLVDCESLISFNGKDNDFYTLEQGFQISIGDSSGLSIRYFDISNNNLSQSAVERLLQAFDEVLSPYSAGDFSGEGRYIDVSGNPGATLTTRAEAYKTSIESFGWSVIVS